MDELPSLIGASSAAGLVARAACHPLDTAKARIQAPGAAGEFKKTLATLRNTLRHEGIAGLYRGFVAGTTTVQTVVPIDCSCALTLFFTLCP